LIIEINSSKGMEVLFLM